MWDVIFCTFVVYILYLLFGAVLFMLLENTSDFVQVDVKDDTFDKMKSVLGNFSSEEVEGAIEAWPSSYSDGGEDRWTFLNAFLFSFHLCTTIGYGDLVARSERGQLLSVAYGVLGVPLNLLFLKILGAAFLQAHRDTQWKVRGEGRQGRLWGLLADLLFCATWLLLLVLLPALALLHLEGWSYTDALYFTFVTFATVGFGDYVAGEVSAYNPYYKLLLVWWIIHGMAFLCMAMDMLARLVNRYCLFALKYEAGRLKVYRAGVDAERLDLHFRLTNYPGLKHNADFWGDVGKSEKAEVLHQSHLATLAHLAEKVRGLLGVEVQKRGGGIVDAFPVKKTSKEPSRGVDSPPQKHVNIRHNRREAI